VKTFKQYITETFDTPVVLSKPIIQKDKNHNTNFHRYNISGKQTGGPRGVVQITRKPGSPSAYVNFDFNDRVSAKNTKIKPTNVALSSLAHVHAALQHHINTHDEPTTHIRYDTDSPRRDRAYKMIGRRLGVRMTNDSAKNIAGPFGILTDIDERGSRIKSPAIKQQYYARVADSLTKRGKRSKGHKRAAEMLNNEMKWRAKQRLMRAIHGIPDISMDM
jgi:hypothetical protein